MFSFGGSSKASAKSNKATKRSADPDFQHDLSASKKTKVDDMVAQPTTTGPSIPEVNEAPPEPAAAMVETNTIQPRAAAADSSLLMLSSKLRKMLIDGEIVFKTPIFITADGSPEEFEPAALATSSPGEYQEAIPFFYCDNSFSLQVTNYNIRAFLPWLDRAKQYRDHAECNGTITIALHGDPHWENLVDWLKLAHSGQYDALDDNCENSGSKFEAVKGAFNQVMDLAAKKYKWVDEVKITLRGTRRMLTANDPRWSDIGTDVITDGMSLSQNSARPSVLNLLLTPKQATLLAITKSHSTMTLSTPTR